MHAPSPLGTIGILPRELRNQVYGRLIGKRYHAHHPQTIVHPQGHRQFPKYCPHVWKQLTAKGLSLLVTSAAIHEEMSEVLFKATFHFDRDIDASDVLIALPYTRFTDRMMKIEIDYDAILHQLQLDYDPVDVDQRMVDFSRALPGPLIFFGGDKIQRDSIQLGFWVGPWPEINLSISETPLFEAIKHLIGFKTVTVRLMADDEFYYTALHTHIGEVMNSWTDAGNSMAELGKCHGLYDGFIGLLENMGKTLEPALGPGKMSELYAGEFSNLKNGGCRHLEFHPRDHISNRSKANRHPREGKKESTSVASSSGIDELGPSMSTLAI